MSYDGDPRGIMNDAAWRGDFGGIEDATDRKDDESFALQVAAVYGDIEGVRKAIEGGGDPKVDESYALQVAAAYGRGDCVRLLIPVSDIEREVEGLRSNFELDGVALIAAIREEESLKSKQLGYALARDISGL